MVAIPYMVASIAGENSTYGLCHRLFRRSFDAHGQYFHSLLALARLGRQGGKLPFGVREQAVDRLLQLALRRVELRRLAFEPWVVLLEPRLVQPVDRCDPLDPFPAPLRQLRLAGRTLDEVAPLVHPAPAQNHLAVELARHLSVAAYRSQTRNTMPLTEPNSFIADLGAARGSMRK